MNLRMSRWWLAAGLGAWGAQAAACSVAVSPLALGSYDATAPRPTDATAVVEVTCKEGGQRLRLEVTHDANALLGGVLHYRLYRDAARVLPWGTGDAALIVGVDATGRARVPVFARIEPGQWVPPGTYADPIPIAVGDLP